MLSGHLPISFWPATQRLPRDADALRRDQERRLAALLGFARRHSPYYREILPREPRPELSGLPILSRAALRERMHAVATVPPDAPGVRVLSTSGWSGRPLCLPASREELLLDALLWLAAYRAHGLRPWHRQVKFAQDGLDPEKRAVRRAWLFRILPVF